MLKKCAAIAVLILLVTSLTVGSLGQDKANVQKAQNTAFYGFAREPAGQAAAAAQAEPGMAYVTRGFVPGGLIAAAPGSVAVPAEKGTFSVTGGIVAGAPDPATGYTSMVIYMNDSWMEVPGFAYGEINAGHEHLAAGARLMMANAMFDNAVIHGKVAMIRPGSQIPDIYEVRWEKKLATSAGRNGSPDLFSAHLIIPPAEGGAGFPNGMGFAGPAGDIELNSDILVDMSKIAAASIASASPYNNVIAMGQDSWHSVDVSNAITSLNVDLKWKNSDNSLRLSIYTPDGHVLGPYTDASDGKDDGRININVANPDGIAAGKWYMKVTGTDVAGKDEYYIKTY